MAARKGPRKLYRYSAEFKLKADVRRHAQRATTKSALDPKRTFAFRLIQAH